jgi:hypothetical protein
MQVLLQDIRYSLRQFIKNPGFTLTALISLALGIGATTAVFSVIYAALMNPYPYPNADRIVRLTMESKSGTDDWANLNGPQIRQLRQLSVIESVLAMDFHAMTLTGPEVPENVNVVGLISTGFTDLGVPPVLGRGLLPSDAIDGEDQASELVGSLARVPQRAVGRERGIMRPRLRSGHVVFPDLHVQICRRGPREEGGCEYEPRKLAEMHGRPP